MVNCAALHVKHQKATWVDSFNPGKLLRLDDSPEMLECFRDDRFDWTFKADTKHSEETGCC